MSYKDSLYILVFAFILCLNASGQRNKFFDGPYVTIDQANAQFMWIEAGKLMTKAYPLSSKAVFSVDSLPQIPISSLQYNTDYESNYEGIAKVAAISDIHGQYELFVKMLTNNGIIDSLGHWAYGDGHLVIVGDVFDRGHKVMECLWLIYQLEQQALAAGGKVHFLLGNHELLVLHGDERYLQSKYTYTAGVNDVPYSEFFSNETFLGQWLRSKNVSVKINDVVYVHGGFSKKVLERGNSLKTINNIFRDNILDDPEIKEDSSFTSQLYFENGPLWYRGYAAPNGFDQKKAKAILDLLAAKTIVVGHTSMPRIIALHDEAIILIDSSIKFGKRGELLMQEDSVFYKCNEVGVKKLLSEEIPDSELESVFEYLYDSEEETPELIIRTDVKELLASKLEEKYIPAVISDANDPQGMSHLKIRIRARGNMRKELCNFPPIKVDFVKSDLKKFGFSKRDKLKLAFQCGKSKKYKEGLYKEYLVYKMYELIDTLALRTKLVKVELTDGKKTKYELAGMIIEDENNFSNRTGGQIVTKGLVMAEGLQRDHFLKMTFFQYLILNTDYSVFNKHNIEIVKMPYLTAVLGLPYDFDYAGIVGMDYAAPHKRLPIEDVSIPFFRGRNTTHEEVEQMHTYYNSIRSELEAVVHGADFLSKKSRKKMCERIAAFYKSINDRENWDKNFINPETILPKK